MKYFKFTLSLFTLLLLFNCTSSPDIDNEIPELNLPPSIGVISTVEITEVTMSSAMSGGVISSDGGSPITAKGIVWGTNPNPTIALTTKTSEGSGTDGFTATLPLVEEYTIGLTYKVTPKWLVSADFNYHGWSRYTQLTLDFASAPLATGNPIARAADPS